MTEQEVRAVVGRYEARVKEDQRADGSAVFLAWYAEVPTCIAEAPNRAAALDELDAIIVAYLQTVMADGVSLPVPLSERVRPVATWRQRIGQVVLGDARTLLGAKSLASARTVTAVPTRIVNVKQASALVKI
jgi:hypothetical protein